MLADSETNNIAKKRIAHMSKKNKPARVITITSGKGGVGKTHTTVNIGLALKKQGNKVLLLDADLGLANINIMLGFKPSSTLHDVLQGRAHIREIIVKHPSGLDVIPAASGISQLTNLSEEERMLLIEAFDDFANEYDYVLIDTAAGIGDNVLYFTAAAEEVLVVIDEEPTSITDAYALIKILSTEWDINEFDIIVNRVRVGSDGKEVFSKLAQVSNMFLQAKLNLFGSVCEDKHLSEAVIKQTPLIELYPSTKAARDFIRLAKKLDSSQSTRKTHGGLQFFFKALVNWTSEYSQ